MHPGWNYHLWTDQENDYLIMKHFPEIHAIYGKLTNGILKSDIARYLIVKKYGGVYLDLDYEIFEPLALGNHQLFIPKEESQYEGAQRDYLGNCIFGSVPDHPFWDNVITHLLHKPLNIKNYEDIVEQTGPGLLTTVYEKFSFDNAYFPEPLLYHPISPRNKKQLNVLKNNGITKGAHHTWASKRNRWKPKNMKRKLQNLWNAVSG